MSNRDWAFPRGSVVAPKVWGRRFETGKAGPLIDRPQTPHRQDLRAARFGERSRRGAMSYRHTPRGVVQRGKKLRKG